MSVKCAGCKFALPFEVKDDWDVDGDRLLSVPLLICCVYKTDL